MIRKLYADLEEILGSILLVVICLIVTVQVASRYLDFVRDGISAVLGDPLTWTEEIGTYVFVYLTFIGAALALKKNEHFALEILTDKLPGRVQIGTRILISVLVITCSGIIVWFGTRLAIEGWVVKTPALEMPRTIPYAAVPLGGLLMAIRSIEAFARQVRSFRRGTVSVDGAGGASA